MSQIKKWSNLQTGEEKKVGKEQSSAAEKGCDPLLT